MSLMAGFDFVAEVSRSALLDLLKTGFAIQGQPANPPFDFDLALPALSASAHMIVSGLDLELTDDDRATITFDFINSSVIGDSPPLVVSALAGKVTIAAPVKLVSSLADAALRELAFDIGTADVNLTYTTTSNKIAAGLAGSGITVAQFKTMSQQAVAGFFTGIGLARFPGVAYRVVANTQGSLNPLQFVKLEAHCIGNADPAKQALGFFGIVLLANAAKGSHTAKTATAITPGPSQQFPHEIAVSISPMTFHTLLFCPAMADSLEVDAASLPIACGPSLGVDKDGVTVHMLLDTFVAGHVSVDGSFGKSGFCYEASGSFHGEITFSVSGSTVTPNVQMDEPEVDVDLDWYCGPIGGVAIGLEALANLALANAIAQSVADGYAADAVAEMAGGVGPQQLGGLSAASLDQAVVTPEGLTLLGVIPMFVPIGGSPDLDIAGSVTTSAKQSVSTGVYEWGIPGFCETKEFDYTEVAQQQTGVYQALPTLLGEPLKLEWSLLAGQTVALSGQSGTVALTKQTHYPLPLDTGGTYMTQPVDIEYVIAGDTITLKNLPSDGNYGITLQCKATDPLGQVETEGQYVFFEGSAVEFEAGYEAYVNECSAKFRAFLAKISDAFSGTVDLIPPWVPIDRPAEEQVIELFLGLSRLPAIRSDPMVARLATAHGSSWIRALLAARNGEVETVKGNIKDPVAG